MIVKPAYARQKVVFVTELESQVYKIVSTGPCELAGVGITAGGSAATFRLLDASKYNSPYSLEAGPSFAVESSNSFVCNFTQPMPFRNGLIIVCEQGLASNAECWVTVNGN